MFIEPSCLGNDVEELASCCQVNNQVIDHTFNFAIGSDIVLLVKVVESNNIGVLLDGSQSIDLSHDGLQGTLSYVLLQDLDGILLSCVHVNA